MEKGLVDSFTKKLILITHCSFIIKEIPKNMPNDSKTNKSLNLR